MAAWASVQGLPGSWVLAAWQPVLAEEYAALWSGEAGSPGPWTPLGALPEGQVTFSLLPTHATPCSSPMASGLAGADIKGTKRSLLPLWRQGTQNAYAPTALVNAAKLNVKTLDNV